MERGHTNKILCLTFICYIYLFEPCLLHVTKEEKHTWTLRHRVGELDQHAILITIKFSCLRPPLSK